MSAPAAPSRPLSSIEGFLCGGLAACVAVCLPRLVFPSQDVIPSGRMAGHRVQSSGGREDAHAATRRACKEGRGEGVQKRTGCPCQDME